MAFEDLAAEMVGLLPGYSLFLAEKAIARAWQDILRQRTWSFLIAEGAFNAPPLVNTGSVTVTTNSTSVVANTAAAAALQAVVAAVPVLIARQFRIGFGGSIYNITAWDNATTTLTLDRPYLEASGVAQPYEVYQCDFPPPPQALLASGLYDFNRWLSVIDAANGYPIGLKFNKAWLDRRDPQRSSAGLAYTIVEYKADSLGTMLYEFWPHPTNGQTFNAIYKRKGAAVITGEEAIPDIIAEDLILTRALYKSGYTWAATNVGRDPLLKGVNWMAQQQEASRQWRADLQSAKLEDDNVNLQSMLPNARRHGICGPIDSTFIQSHDMGAFIR